MTTLTTQPFSSIYVGVVFKNSCSSQKRTKYFGKHTKRKSNNKLKNQHADKSESDFKWMLLQRYYEAHTNII